MFDLTQLSYPGPARSLLQRVFLILFWRMCLYVELLPRVQNTSVNVSGSITAAGAPFQKAGDGVLVRIETSSSEFSLQAADLRLTTTQAKACTLN